MGTPFYKPPYSLKDAEDIAGLTACSRLAEPTAGARGCPWEFLPEELYSKGTNF